MTNWEKFKEGLTAEEFLRISEQWCGNLPICKGCAKSDGDCHKAFLYWATGEPDEEDEE